MTTDCPGARSCIVPVEVFVIVVPLFVVTFTVLPEASVT